MRLLRFGVPAGVVVIIALIIATTWLNPLRNIKLPNMGKLVVSGSKITMELPKVSGYTADARAYNLTARSAAQDITKPDLVELQDIRGRMEMVDKTIIDLSAATGLYNSKTEILLLNDNINVISSSGYEGYLTEAVVNIKTSHIVSEKPVEIKLLNGVINSKRLEVIEGGDLIRFDGGVVMNVKLDSPPAADTRPDKTKAR